MGNSEQGARESGMFQMKVVEKEVISVISVILVQESGGTKWMGISFVKKQPVSRDQ